MQVRESKIFDGVDCQQNFMNNSTLASMKIGEKICLLTFARRPSLLRKVSLNQGGTQNKGVSFSTCRRPNRFLA